MTALASLTVPKPLSPGATIAVVSPSWGGAARFPHRFEAGLACLRDRFGFRIREMPHTRADAAWLADNPRARADDLNAAFADPDVDGIVAAIGGEDAVRLEPFLDLAALAAHPKAFVGYSDTTALHFACLKAGVRSFHGPSVMSGFAENGEISPATEAGFRVAVMADAPFALPWSQDGWATEHLDWSDPANQSRTRRREPSSGPRVLQGQGQASGRLIGGCLEVLEMLKATPWWPAPEVWDGAMLFLETSEEAPSAHLVKRWIRNYGSQGILQRAGGLLLGRAANMDAEGRRAQEAAVLSALAEWGLTDLPVIGDLDIGHTDPIVTLPYGAEAVIDCETGVVTVQP